MHWLVHNIDVGKQTCTFDSTLNSMNSTVRDLDLET